MPGLLVGLDDGGEVSGVPNSKQLIPSAASEICSLYPNL